MKRYLIFILLTGFAVSFAQTSKLPIPLNMKKAYESGTRTLSGAPGPQYWTNHSDYKISVNFNPQNGHIDGEANIIYYNSSPDTLTEIVIRLYADIFKAGGLRDWPVNKTDLHDGVEISNLEINKTSYSKDEQQRIGTNLILKLKDSILPNTQAIIKVKWNYNLPQITPFRMGKYDSTSYFVAYWFPQISVYDDIDGWDKYNYGGLQEFYNDCNNFDVRISAPENYIVWASGVLQNPQELLPKKLFKRYKQALTSNEIIHLIDSSEVNAKAFKINTQNKSWHFVAENVPDFAFATSDHYLWDMCSPVVDKNAKRRVTIHTAYKKESADFYKVAEISKESIHYFSNTLPAVPFPYPELTVFNGGGGMEFPMMVNDGSAKHHSGTVHVTSHEIAHTYFPFYLGTNERKYAWMDEGWANMLPIDTQSKQAPGYDPMANTVNRYLEVAGQEMDIPMMIPSIVYHANVYRPSYRNAAYDRSSISYNLLKHTLGKTLFTKAMQVYISEWHHKHPIPNDFFFTFNRVSGQDLSWFWKPWFFESGYPDLGIKQIEKVETGYEIEIERIGILPIPIYLTVIYESGETEIIEQKASVWKSGNTLYKVVLNTNKKINKVILGNAHVPDVNKENNTF